MSNDEIMALVGKLDERLSAIEDKLNTVAESQQNVDNVVQQGLENLLPLLEVVKTQGVMGLLSGPILS